MQEFAGRTLARTVVRTVFLLALAQVVASAVVVVVIDPGGAAGERDGGSHLSDTDLAFASYRTATVRVELHDGDATLAFDGEVDYLAGVGRTTSGAPQATPIATVFSRTAAVTSDDGATWEAAPLGAPTAAGLLGLPIGLRSTDVVSPAALEFTTITSSTASTFLDIDVRQHDVVVDMAALSAADPHEHARLAHRLGVEPSAAGAPLRLELDIDDDGLVRRLVVHADRGPAVYELVDHRSSALDVDVPPVG